MNEQEVSKLYNALLSKGYSTDDLGTAERFAEMMSSADNRKTLYDYVRSRGDFKIGNFDAYERRLAGQPLGEPQGAGVTEPQGAGVAATQSQHTEQPDTLSDEARSRMEEGARIGGGLTASMQAPQGAGGAVTQSPQTEQQGAGVAATESPQTEQQRIDRSPGERMSVARTVAGARAVSGAVGAQQANAERYREGRRTSGQIRLGLGEERPSFFGGNPNVVASQQFNPQTGERETTYLTETGNEYTNKEGAVAEQNYHDAQHRLDKYKTELPVDINADAEERGRQLDAALEENSRRMRELSETRDTEERGFWQMLSDAISMSPTLGGSPTRQWSESDATRDQLRTLGAERDLLEQARRTNAVLRDLRKSDGFFDLNNVTNFVRGVKDESSDIRGMGLRDLFTATALKDIKDKMDRNEPLNDTELSLLAAAGVNSEIQTVAQGEMPHGYTAGVTTAAMAPFMAQLAMVPSGGLGGLFGRYATQMYGKAGLKSLAARAAAKISGDVLTSAILANTLQAPATYADALNRMTGDVTTDENGRVSFVGGESAGDSFRKAITAATIENYTEMAFEGNGGIGKQALTRLADRLGLQGVRNTLSRITRSQALDAVRRFESQVRWGGTIEEALEEELGIVLNSMFVGDNQLSDLVDADQQIDIILGVGVFGGAVSALKSGLYLRQQRNLSRAAEAASAHGAVLFGDDRWDGIRARIDDADSDEALQSEISSLIQDPSLDNAQRRAVLEYGARRGAYQGYNYGMQIVRDEMSDAMRDGFDAFQVGMELSGSQLNDAGRTARNAKTFLNGTPDGQSIADAVDALIDAGTREEDVNAYFSSLPEGPSREAALDYFTSMMTLQGAAARMLEDAQAGISRFEADVDAGTSMVNGEPALVVATVDGQQAYVLDNNGSTALVMVDGEKRQVLSSAVENPVTFRPDAYKAQYRESVEQSINDELNFRFNNHANTEMPRVGLELHNGEDTYQIVDVNGATGAVTATRVKLDKNGQLVPDGGALVTLTTQDVLDMQNQYYEELDARQAGEAPLAATESQQTEPQGAEGAATESRQTGQDVVEAAEQEVLAVSPEGADYIDSIRQLIDSYGSVNESFYDGVPQNLVEPLRRYAEAYAGAATEAGPQSTGADAVQTPPAGEPQGTVTDYPRDKDGDLDVDAIRQTGDSQMMSDALRSEFGDEQANAMAQQFLSEAVQAQEKEKNPVKRNGSRQKAVDFWRDVAGRLNTAPAAEPQGVTTRQPLGEPSGTASDAVRAKWEGAAKIEGNAGSKTLPGGQRIRGRYVLVEEGAATPSHDPSTFRPNEGFPITESGQNANSRDYENDANAQASVQQMGGTYDGRAVDDTPVVSSEGVVWSGNNRVMSGQLAAQNGTDAGYKESLMDNAAMYGFTPEQVDGMAHPRVYFVPDAGQGLDYTPQTFNLFNAPQQKEEGSVGKGVKMGKVLTDRTFGLMSQIVSDYGSLANVFKSANACRDLVRIMQEAEEIVEVNQQTLPRYLTPDGLLTEDGQNLVNAALVGYMFRDNAEVLGYLERLPKSAIRQMADAMPELVANARMGEYALGAELAEAIKALYQQSESGQSMEDFMRQYDLFAEGGTLYGETTKALMEAMSGRVANATNGTLKDLMSQYNERAADAASGQGDMFSRNSREDILRDVLGLAPAEAATLSQQTEPQEAGASGEENSQNTSEQTNNSLSLQPENERNDGSGKVEDSDGGGDGVDGAHAAASRLLRGISIEPVSERQEGGSKERLLAEVEKSARDSGQWLEGIASQLDGYQLSSGGENEVYLANGEITKLNNFAFLRDDATNFEDFLNRIESFNDLFPDVALRLLGFAKNSKGEICVVMSQPAITNSREATEEEIDAALEDMGFYTDISGEWTDGRYVISDLKPNNVLVDSEGHLHFIDVVTFDDTKPGRMMVPRKPEGEEDAVTESQQTERPEAEEDAVTESQQTEQRDAEGEEKARKAFSDDVTSRMIMAVQTGEKPYKGIVDLRSRAKELGMTVDDRGGSDILLQELFEDGLVRAANQIIGARLTLAVIQGEDVDTARRSKELFDRIVKLYEMQPTLGARSTGRIAKQQYSTPLPMAYAAGMFAYDERMELGLEPTAGNGMLTIAVPARKVHVNEIDAQRLENLRGQGFAEVTDQDATQPFEGGRQYDFVIANPPFGSAEEKSYGGKLISGLDPQIALNALESMKDDGKAVIIIGGNMEYEKNGSIRNKKQFFTYLYDRYNVKGVLDMAGGLYQKQGTTYPTRMILIDGRRSDAEREQTTVYPPRESEALPKVETYDDLYRVVTELINSKEKTNGNEVLRTAPRELESDDFGKSRPSEQRPDNRQSGADDTQPGGGGRVGDDLATSPSSGGRSVLGERGQADRAGSERGQHGQPGRVPGQRGESGGDNSRLAQQGGDRRNSGDSDGRVVERDRSGSLAGRDLVSTDESAREKRELGQEKLSYIPHNSAFSLESVAPAAMVESMNASLSEIEKEVGPIDEFVRSELGYDTVEEAHNALAAEQMDSVAMAIYQMKQGQALIIGDQTGVGKGRQMAALIRWAVRQGKKPIFFTKDANLFSDIYRDLVDVGSGDLRPFIFNAASGENPGVMTDNNGKVIYSAPRPSAQAKILASDSLPDDYDYAVLSYSQVNKGDAKSREEARAAAKSNGGRAKKKDTGTEKPTPKADFLRKIAKDNYLFLDESHTAAGEASNTGAYLQSLVKDAKGVTFASATFAKTPETMPLYALRTAMSKAMIKANELIGIIKKGGITLQEIMSRALSEGGQMVRRERDMSDVRTDWKTVDDPATVKRARENYDRTIAAFNAIIRFQELYVGAKINELDAQLSMQASSADVKRGTKKMGIDNTPFASKAYNYTKQLLLALKVDAIVDEVEAEIKAGRHPVIALDSTMESATKDYSVGEVVSEPSFALSLLRGLDSVMQYTVTDENGNKVSYSYTPADLGPAGEAAYYQLQDFIRKSTKDIFISPIDAIIERLNEKGYKVGELTGRKSYVRHDEDGRVRITARTDRDKKRQAREFNSGELDVLILNKSAATGISLHASEKFADQRQRTMIIAQPLGDINDYMQMIGRIDRTGQVHRGYYINLGLPVPAENRFLMMLATKLRSLNANTTTSQESKSNDVEAPDLLNKYGSQVIIEYLRDNPDIYEKMGRPLKGANGEVGVTQLDEYTPKEDDASLITGRVALLTTEEQDAFYDDVVKRYNDLIKYLDETGTNDLEITVMPLRAKTLSKKVSSEGSDPSGKNPFAGNAYVEEVEMDVLRKPMTAEDVRKTMAQLNGGNSDGGTVGHSDERVREIKSTIVNETEAKIVAENARYERAQARVEEDIEKRTERINASNRTAEEKRQAIEEYAEEHRAEAENDHNERVSRLREQGSNFVRRLGWFDVGQTCMVPDDLTTDTYMFMSPAIFCGYKAKDSKVTPSTTFAVFATLDGRRRVEVKMSQIGALINIKNATENNWDSVRQTTLANWDSRLPKSTRRKGYIMTGNILQAVSDTQDQAGNYPGQLISYTDENGGVHDGILMPEKWTPSQLKTAGAPISSRIEQIKNLRSGEKVVSTDGKVSFSRDWRGTLTLDVPKSKKEGGKYYLNDELLEHVRYNEFNTYRGQMEAVISNSEIEAVVNILSQMGVRVATEEDAATESQQTEPRGDESSEGGISFSLVTDPFEIVRLEQEPKVRRYRAMAEIDGKLYPPMSVKVDGKLRPDTPVGAWEKADETPLDITPELQASMDELDRKAGRGDVVIVPNKVRYHKEGKSPYDPTTGKGSKGVLQFKLVKDDGTDVWAAYNPYFHTSTSALNDQFTSAYKRPNLVVAEVEIPESELTSGHRSAYAKDAVGDVDWKSGEVNGSLPEDRRRTVTLSRWAKVVRVVPVAEAADMIAEQLEGTDSEIPFNVVTPSLRDELAERGVTISAPTKGNAGKAAIPDYEEWRASRGGAATESRQTEPRGTEGVRFSVVEPIADFDARKISEAKTNAEWAEAVTESDNVARAKRRVAPIVEKVAQEYRGISRVIISTGKSFLEELAKDERLSDEDRNDLLAVANGEIEAPNAGYIASIDKIIIFNLGASESEIKSYLCHEIAHRAIRHLALSGRMSDWAEVLERLNPTLAKYVREAYARYGRDAQIPEEVVAHIIEHLVRDYGVEGTRSRLQNLEANNGEKAKGLTSIIDFIEHGRQRENQQAERENQSREGSTEGNAVERDVRARGERYSLLGSEPGSREDGGVAFSLGAVARNSGSARVEYEATVNGMAHRLRETWQDSMLSLKALQDAVTKETGRKLLDTQNAWMAENRLSSMNAAQQEEFRREQMRPLLKAVAALGGAKKREHAAITKYMIAKHGLERNRVFAQRDGITSPKDYSGLTSLFRTGDVQDAERMAQDYVDQFESAHDTEAIDALWDAVRGVSQFALRKSLETGMISEDTFHTLMGQFDYYVPLRGWDEPTSDEVYDYIGLQESPLANVIKHAKGRTSVADDPIATLQNLAESAIIAGNRNMVKQHFLNLATMHKTDLVSVSRMWLRYDDVSDTWEAMFPDNIDDNDTPEEVAQKTEVFNQRMEALAKSDPDHYKLQREKADIPYIVKPDALRGHRVLVKQGGRTYVLTVNGNPRAAQAVNGLTNPDAGSNVLTKAVASGSRWIASWATAKNVGFIASNLVRDGLYTVPMSFIKEGGEYGVRYTANWWACLVEMPSLLRKLNKGTLDNSDPSSLEGMFYDFVHNGGETGYTIVNDVEACKKYLSKELRGNVLRSSWDAVNDVLQFIGRWSEGIGRFAAFRTSLEMGRSRSRAIFDAKDISVNFSKKGSGISTAGKWENASALDRFIYTMASLSQQSRAFYSFFNASVQGIENITRVSWHNKGKALGLFGGLMAIGAGQALLNGLMKSLIGGDDDDKYYNLPEWQRSSNFILYLGKYWPGGWLKLPIPIEFSVPFGLGGLFTERFNDEETMSDRAFGLRFAQQLGKALPLDPTSEDSYFNANALWPTILRPVADVTRNVSWTGLPIANQTEWNKFDPEYKRVYKNAKPLWVGVSKALSEATGGSEGRRGSLELNPQKAAYLAKQYFGGGYNWFERPINLAQDVLGKKDFDWQDVPVLYRFTTTTDRRALEKRINARFYDMKSEMDATHHEHLVLKRNVEAAANDPLELARRRTALMDYEKGDAYTEYCLWHEGEKQLTKVREAAKESGSNPENEYMLKQQMVDVVRTYRQTKDANKAASVYRSTSE